MALNDDLFARFAVEHFDRHSISTGRRVVTLLALTELGNQLGDRDLSTLTASDLMAWQGSQLKRGLKPNTVRNRESMIRAFIGWAYVAGVIDFERSLQLKNVTSVRGATAHLKPRPYKRAEIERWREVLDARMPLAPTSGPGSRQLGRYLRGVGPYTTTVRRHARRLQYEAQVSLALEEGLRLTELHRLTIAEMHYDNAAVVVRSLKSKPGEERVREVPYTPHSRECVRDWLDFRALLPLEHDDPWLMLIRYSPRAPQRHRTLAESLEGFDGPWTWHRFRHTFATERLRAGMPLEKLQIMLGHANLSQTLAYAEIVNADVQKEAERTEDAFARNLGLVTV